jgi:hypothetical protein
MVHLEVHTNVPDEALRSMVKLGWPLTIQIKQASQRGKLIIFYVEKVLRIEL